METSADSINLISPHLDDLTHPIVGVGIDLVENNRIRKILDRFGERFLNRIFTQHETDYCVQKPDPVQSLSARFAVKEAVYKALNGEPGMNLAWKDCETVSNPSGIPEIILHGSVRKRADELGVGNILLSLTHDINWSAAVVIALGKK